MRSPRKKTGFTLIEVMLVLAIVLVLAAMTLPMMTGTLENQRLQHSANIIRAEWKEIRLQAMEEGQIFCIRFKLGGNEMMIDRILDAHFTASLSSRETNDRFRINDELDPFEKGGFSGKTEDFILRDPGQASEETGAQFVQFPGTVFTADVLTIPEERAAFYLGLTTAGENSVEENTSESEEVARQETRFGETSAADGGIWSTPIFFYPDGTTSTAAVLLKNGREKCIEVRLRGLTGTGTVSETVSVDNYTGELDPSKQRDEQISPI